MKIELFTNEKVKIKHIVRLVLDALDKSGKLKFPEGKYIYIVKNGELRKYEN